MKPDRQLEYDGVSFLPRLSFFNVYVYQRRLSGCTVSEERERGRQRRRQPRLVDQSREGTNGEIDAVVSICLVLEFNSLDVRQIERFL